MLLGTLKQNDPDSTVEEPTCTASACLPHSALQSIPCLTASARPLLNYDSLRANLTPMYFSCSLLSQLYSHPSFQSAVGLTQAKKKSVTRKATPSSLERRITELNPLHFQALNKWKSQILRADFRGLSWTPVKFADALVEKNTCQKRVQIGLDYQQDQLLQAQTSGSRKGLRMLSSRKDWQGFSPALLQCFQDQFWARGTEQLLKWVCQTLRVDYLKMSTEDLRRALQGRRTVVQEVCDNYERSRLFRPTKKLRIS